MDTKFNFNFAKVEATLAFHCHCSWPVNRWMHTKIVIYWRSGDQCTCISIMTCQSCMNSSVSRYGVSMHQSVNCLRTMRLLKMCYATLTLDKKTALLRLNAMRNFIVNVKHHIYARIYTHVNIYTLYANIYNTFTAYVKVQTYLHTYLRHICRASKCATYLRTYLLYVCSY